MPRGIESASKQPKGYLPDDTPRALAHAIITACVDRYR
ncbi:MAG: hypothetical protein QOE41_1341, partial [Mycobacterium sp.]|nr:hypothetical protein [Mycobacterium sp.]